MERARERILEWVMKDGERERERERARERILEGVMKPSDWSGPQRGFQLAPPLISPNVI